MSKVAFIGLGVMGFPMAGHLRERGGHEVSVYNRTAAKAQAWAERFGGRAAETPAMAADGADFVFACVGNDDDLRAVTTGPGGAFHALKPGTIFIDNTTASASVARELHAAALARGAHFLDAPVSGGQSGAEAGQLTVMVGGDEAPFAAAQPVIAAYARAVTHMGPSGAGQLTKMVNQICIVGMLQGLAEGIHFAQSAGLDVEAVIATLRQGAAQSWQMDNRWKPMNEAAFDFGFAVEWMRKDLSICLDEARNNGARLPLAALIDQFYAEIEAMGGRRWDTCSLIARLNRS